MSELSKADAEIKRKAFLSKMEKVKKEIGENFAEMDFENAVERTKMEGYVKEMEEECSRMIGRLEEMTFE